MITVTPDAPDQISTPKTVVTAFDTNKSVPWSASDEFHYVMGAGPTPVQYYEDAYSLVIFGSDRFTILDVIKFSRFEEISCLTVVKMAGDTYVFVGTSLIFPGIEIVEQVWITVALENLLNCKSLLGSNLNLPY